MQLGVTERVIAVHGTKVDKEDIQEGCNACGLKVGLKILESGSFAYCNLL